MTLTNWLSCGPFQEMLSPSQSWTRSPKTLDSIESPPGEAESFDHSVTRPSPEP